MNRFFRILPLLLLPVCASAQVVVQGTLLGADNGKAIPVAHVHLKNSPNDRTALLDVEAQRNGNYTLTIANPGSYALEFTGVDHASYEVPLYVPENGNFKLDVKLAPNVFPVAPTHMQIIGDFNDFSFRSAKEMVRQPDGTFAITLDTRASEVAYQVMNEGIPGNEAATHSVNGTQYDKVAYDGGGDYRSVVASKNGKVTIVFDPSKTAHSTALASASFGDEKSIPARYLALDKAQEERSAKYIAAARAFMAAHPDNDANSAVKFSYDGLTDIKELTSQMQAEHNGAIKQVMLVQALSLRHTGSSALDTALSVQALREIAPTSAAWALSPSALMKVTELTGNKSYLENVLAKNSGNDLRSVIVFQQLEEAYYGRDTANARALYNRLVSDFPNSPYTAEAKMGMNPDRAVHAGTMVPAFKFVSLTNPNVTYTNESMKGKYYMIDFWATWCGPCKGEMASMHKAYERFHGKNFEILSLSFDQAPGDVAKYRAGKWKMPWLHTFIDEGFQSPAAKTFEVMGIPKPILVDPTGKIVAMEEELRGAELEKTLAKFLGNKELGDRQ